MDIIAFRLHTNHSVAVPRGSALFVRSGAVAWGDLLLDPNHALLTPAFAQPAVITGAGAPASITMLIEPRIDFGEQACVRLIDSAAFLEHFYLTLTLQPPRSVDRLAQFICAVRARGLDKPELSAHAPSYGRVIQQYLSSTLARSLSLADVAQAAALSPHTASRVFHREAGLPLRTYVRRIRLRTALARIADRNNLSQVALELGFFDHAHFTNAFRAEFGMTPSQWRTFAQPFTRHADR